MIAPAPSMREVRLRLIEHCTRLWPHATPQQIETFVAAMAPIVEGRRREGQAPGLPTVQPDELEGVP